MGGPMVLTTRSFNNWYKKRLNGGPRRDLASTGCGHKPGGNKDFLGWEKGWKRRGGKGNSLHKGQGGP